MKRRLSGVVLLPLLLLLAACSDDSPSFADPAGSEADKIAGVWWLMLGLAAGVYVIVAGFIIYGALRGRGTEAGRASRFGDNAFIWTGGVVVPVVILGVLAAVTIRTTSDLNRPQRGSLPIQVEAVDWWWEVRYPNQDIVTANEIRVPVGRQVAVTLTTRDVIHSFWVPELAGKIDAIPGQPNVLRFTADEPGVYRGQCAEYCGIQHANMAFLVVAQEPADFERWVTRQQRPPSEPVSELAARGQVVFTREACAGCHTVRGTQATGDFGPDLTDFGSRRTIGAGVAPHTRGHLAGWIVNAQSLKPGNLMPPITLSPDDVDALIAYLESLE